MEVLKDTPVLVFNPNTIEEVRKEFNLDHEGIKKLLDNFEEWISKQQHFTKKDFSRNYLEICIINAKGSLERAKNNLEKLCTLKTLLPSFFDKHDVKTEIIDTSGLVSHGTVPKLLKNNNRVYVIKLLSSDFNMAMLLDHYKYMILTNEYLKINDYNLGFVAVVDCRDVNLINFVTNININEFRNLIVVLMEGYAARVSAIYVISSSKTVDVFVTLLKQVFSKKIAGRINVIKTVEALHKCVPKEILPKDYGGEEKTLKEIHENWTNTLATKENIEYFKEMSQARTDEKHRLPAQYNEQVLGMPGSFRTLTVD